MSQLEEYLFKADDASLFNVEEPMFKIDEPSIHMANTSRNEPLDWDSFKCLRHPSFKVDALYIDESGCYDPKLLCMKCIIEEDCFSGPRKFITVKDLREYYIDSLTKSIPSGEDLSNQNFNEIFMDFYQQNYVTTYEKHIKSQFDIVSSEIDNIINDLTQLKEKYKDFYSTELVEHSFKAEEVKKNVKKYFDEKGDTQAFDASQLSAQFNSMKTNDDYCRFLRKLYYLSKEVKEDTGKSYCYVQTLQKIDQLKNKALNLEENRANVDYLQGNNY